MTKPTWKPTKTNRRVFVKHERECAANDGGRCRCNPKYRGELWNPDTKRPDKSRAFDAYGEAESWVTDRRRGVENPGPPKKRGAGMTNDEFMALFFAAMKSGDARGKRQRRYAEKTTRDYEAIWNLHWSGHVGNDRVDDMDTMAWQRAYVKVATTGARDMKRQPTGEPLSDHTLQCLLTPIRAAYRWATHASRRLVASNATRDMDVPAGERKKRKRVVPPEDVPKLLAALTDLPTRVFWAFAFYAGMRRAEILALDWADVTGGEIVVPESKTATGRERRIPIVPQLDAILADYRKTMGAGAFIGPILPGKRAFRLSDQTIYARTKTLWEAAGLTVYTPHEGRHTFASIAVANRDVSLADLQAWLGHASLEETAGYVQTLPGYRRESAANRLAASFG
jgi:integrase